LVAAVEAVVAEVAALVSEVDALASDAAAAVAAACAAATSAPTISGIPSISVSVNKPPLDALSVAPVKDPGLAGVAIILTLSR
jgi:hypothetical protein